MNSRITGFLAPVQSANINICMICCLFFQTFRSLRLFSSPPCPKCYPTDEVDFVSRNPVNNSEKRADLNGDNQFPL